MTVSIEGTFWLPENPSELFSGMIRNETELTLNLTDAERILQIYKVFGNSESVIILGNLSSTGILPAEKLTIIASLENPVGGKVVFNIKYKFFNAHFTTSEIKFYGLIINFANIQTWISLSNIMYDQNKNTRNDITLGFKKGYSMKLYYANPITEADKETISPSGYNVYIRIDSENEMMFEQLFATVDAIQDFFNFLITEKEISIKSIYGIQKNDVEERNVVIQLNPCANHNRNKYEIITPSLLEFRRIETRLEEMLNRWFDFEKGHKSIYNYYMESMISAASIEFIFFNLVAFIEGYNRVFVEKEKSRIRKLKDNRIDLITKMVEEIEIENPGDTVIKDILNANKKLTDLPQRLNDIFEHYSDIILLCEPILSLYSMERIKKWTHKVTSDRNTIDKISQIIALKIDADDGSSNYDQIVESIKNEHVLVRCALLCLAKYILVDRYSRDFARYRNTVALLEEEYSGINIQKWNYSVKIIQLVGQMCILDILGFSLQEIQDIYCIDGVTDEKTLEAIIRTKVSPSQFTITYCR